jgi:hypothetical protein
MTARSHIVRLAVVVVLVLAPVLTLAHEGATGIVKERMGKSMGLAELL